MQRKVGIGERSVQHENRLIAFPEEPVVREGQVDALNYVLTPRRERLVYFVVSTNTNPSSSTACRQHRFAPMLATQAPTGRWSTSNTKLPKAGMSPFGAWRRCSRCRRTKAPGQG